MSARLFRRAAMGALALLAVAAPPLAGAGEEPRVTVRLSPDPVALDELATLEVQVSGSGFDSPKIDPDFELENLEAVAGPYQAQNFSWVNGRTSSTFQLIWRLRPLAAGTARVKALRLTVDGRESALADQEIAVVEQAPPGRMGAGSPARPAPADPLDELFDTRGLGRRRPAAQQPKVRVRAEVEPANPVVGQQIAYRLVLYTQSDISAFNPLGLPDFRGFWAREVTLPDKVRPEWVELDGERFGRVVMLQRALYPLQSGKLTLGPIEVEVVARIAQSGFFGTRSPSRSRCARRRNRCGRRAAIAAASARVQRRGRRPRGRRQARPGATTEVGQAATLTVTAESRGNLQGLPAPELALAPGLTAYAPRPKASERIVGGALDSRQTWTYVLVPDRAGDFAVPAITLAYFDPAAGRYATAAARPVPSRSARRPRRPQRPRPPRRLRRKPRERLRPPGRAPRSGSAAPWPSPRSSPRASSRADARPGPTRVRAGACWPPSNPARASPRGPPRKASGRRGAPTSRSASPSRPTRRSPPCPIGCASAACQARRRRRSWRCSRRSSISVRHPSSPTSAISGTRSSPAPAACCASSAESHPWSP